MGDIGHVNALVNRQGMSESPTPSGNLINLIRLHLKGTSAARTFDVIKQVNCVSNNDTLGF